MTKEKQGDLESKQQLAKEKLAEIKKKEKPTDPVKDEGTINFPVKGVEQRIFHRDFKILGMVGEPVVSAVVHVVQPGLQLRRYLENMTELKILQFHFHEKNTTEL